MADFIFSTGRHNKPSRRGGSVDQTVNASIKSVRSIRGRPDIFRQSPQANISRNTFATSRARASGRTPSRLTRRDLSTVLI